MLGGYYELDWFSFDRIDLRNFSQFGSYGESVTFLQFQSFRSFCFHQGRAKVFSTNIGFVTNFTILLNQVNRIFVIYTTMKFRFIRMKLV